MASVEPYCVYGCGAKRMSGYAFNGAMWVCGHCERPTQQYLEGLLSEDGISLHLFRYGPHHDELWSTEQLLYKNDDLPSAAWVAEYVFTDQMITGSKSGRVARVWEHRDSTTRESLL